MNEAQPPPKLQTLRIIWAVFVVAQLGFGVAGVLAAAPPTNGVLALVLPILAFTAPLGGLLGRRTALGGTLALAPPDSDARPSTDAQRQRFSQGLIFGLMGAEISSILGLAGAISVGMPIAPFVGWGLLFTLLQFPTEAGIRQVR